MYTLVLTLHSWIRWVALVSGFGATFAAMRGGAAPSQTGRADGWGLALMMALDVQLLLGLLLYLVVSPNMQAIRADFGTAMKDPVARFWAVEHLTTMLAAVVVVHIGRVLARKASGDAKRARMLVAFGVATILMIVAIPWPGLRAGRPLLRPFF
jgi:hypothetical protein